MCEAVSDRRVKSYLTGDGPIPLRDTLGVDVTGVGQAVATAELRLAALHLISCEARLTAAAVIRALRRREKKDIWFSLDSDRKATQQKKVLPHTSPSVQITLAGGLTTEL